MQIPIGYSLWVVCQLYMFLYKHTITTPFLPRHYKESNDVLKNYIFIYGAIGKNFLRNASLCMYKCCIRGGCCMIYTVEDQAFSRSYDLAPHPPPLPLLPSGSSAGDITGRLRKRDNLLSGEGGKGMNEGSNHTTARNPGPL